MLFRTSRDIMCDETLAIFRLSILQTTACECVNRLTDCREILYVILLGVNVIIKQISRLVDCEVVA